TRGTRTRARCSRSSSRRGISSRAVGRAPRARPWAPRPGRRGMESALRLRLRPRRAKSPRRAPSPEAAGRVTAAGRRPARDRAVGRTVACFGVLAVLIVAPRVRAQTAPAFGGSATPPAEPEAGEGDLGDVEEEALGPRGNMRTRAESVSFDAKER